MKKIQKTYLRIVNKLIAIIAAFTGLQACGLSITPGYAPPAPLPIAEFSIQGRVETKLNTPIPNIEITTSFTTCEETEEIIGVTRCDDLGNFSIHKDIHYDKPQSINLIFTDVDGEQYGSFKSDTINIPLEYEYTEVTDLVITLEEEEQDKEESTN